MANPPCDRDGYGCRGAHSDTREGIKGKDFPFDLAPYARCWVAVVNGRVVAIGKTAREALLAARYQRLKEEPALIWVPTVVEK